MNIFNIEEPIGQAEIQEMLSNYVPESELPTLLNYQLLRKNKSVAPSDAGVILPSSQLPKNYDGRVMYVTISNSGSRNVVAIIRVVLKSNYPGAAVSSISTEKLYNDTTNGATPTVKLSNGNIELDTTGTSGYTNPYVSVVLAYS